MNLKDVMKKINLHTGVWIFHNLEKIGIYSIIFWPFCPLPPRLIPIFELLFMTNVFFSKNDIEILWDGAYEKKIIFLKKPFTGNPLNSWTEKHFVLNISINLFDPPPPFFRWNHFNGTQCDHRWLFGIPPHPHHPPILSWNNSPLF